MQTNIQKAIKCITNVFLAGAIYVTFLGPVNGLFKLASPVISTQTQLEGILETRKTIAGLSGKTIIARLTDEDMPSSVDKNPDGSYNILLNKDGHCVYTLDHELSHIKDSGLDYPVENPFLRELSYLFCYEPSAVIYSMIHSGK